jgi:hypothetical protein
MKVALKEKYNGQLSLEYNALTGEFSYILVYQDWNSTELQAVKIEEGDEILIRNPHDGSPMIHRVVELDYDSHKQMDIDTGKYYQIVGGQRLKGVQVGVEPHFWLNMFIQRYNADLTKSV